ncbi:UNKNOWN [Stylonychia lemnae]|uniref:Transmembrane protein n=1 Tax=Stylonychia lemnae TaxID=5949 RepID=A0A078AL61_STYLE|nr:UNKNOWN [Stylonychia lemnae]|eukprot:CDW81603.1 UNKNOWN [Stylonychia lemnae]
MNFFQQMFLIFALDISGQRVILPERNFIKHYKKLIQLSRFNCCGNEEIIGIYYLKDIKYQSEYECILDLLKDKQVQEDLTKFKDRKGLEYDKVKDQYIFTLSIIIAGIEVTQMAVSHEVMEVFQYGSQLVVQDIGLDYQYHNIFDIQFSFLLLQETDDIGYILNRNYQEYHAISPTQSFQQGSYYLDKQQLKKWYVFYTFSSKEIGFTRYPETISSGISKIGGLFSVISFIFVLVRCYHQHRLKKILKKKLYNFEKTQNILKPQKFNNPNDSIQQNESPTFSHNSVNDVSREVIAINKTFNFQDESQRSLMDFPRSIEQASEQMKTNKLAIQEVFSFESIIQMHINQNKLLLDIKEMKKQMHDMESKYEGLINDLTSKIRDLENQNTNNIQF